MIDISQFLTETRACLIAPAGYGKTHSIVECLSFLQDRQLILTHTHAGVASLKAKLANARIPPSRYELSTISAFAQRLALSYSSPDSVPIRTTRGSEYFDWVIVRATALANNAFIEKTMAISYKGIIVDEYQDCTVNQHELILALAHNLPLRVLGDPMQGIFGFGNQSIVDFNIHLAGFAKYELDVPYRWLGTNPTLGSEIATLRECLENGKPIVFSRFSEIHYECQPFNTYQSFVTRLSRSLYKAGSTVIIVSDSKRRTEKISVARFFNGQCSIVEAIDDKEFYELARQIDGLTAENAKLCFYNIASKVFFKSCIDAWINQKGIIRKKDKQKRMAAQPLQEALDRLSDNPTPNSFYECLNLLKELPDVILLNHEKFFAIQNSLHGAIENCSTVQQSMEKDRDMIRVFGRRIRRFSVGTTLLIKGLEFDNVIVVNKGDKFDLSTEMGRRNFYVAISRACRRLYIIDVC